MIAPELPPKLLSVAPMMDWTTRHARNFLRLCSPQARLYTEMVTTQALVYGDIPRHLRFEALEHPIALQLGGSDIKDLVHCAKLHSLHRTRAHCHLGGLKPKGKS